MKGCCAHGKDIGLLVLRLGAGAILVYHGYGKLFGGAPGMEMFTGMVDNLGFPLPAFFAYCAALTEFFGGIALILGFGTPVFGVLAAIVMLVALVGVKKTALPAGDPDLALLAISLSLVAMGAGKYSLDAKLCNVYKKYLPKKLAACCEGHDGDCCKM